MKVAQVSSRNALKLNGIKLYYKAAGKIQNEPLVMGSHLQPYSYTQIGAGPNVYL